MFLDQISNEYSVYYLNYTDFPVSCYYKDFESNLIKIADGVIKSNLQKINNSSNKSNFLNQIKENDFFDLKLINKTKKLFRNIILENIKNQIEGDIFILFDEYLAKTKPSEKDIDYYFYNYECNQDKQSKT